MLLKILGSSSKANGYLLIDSSNHSLVIEAGVRLSTVKKALGYNLSGIQGLIVSHSHQDHSKYIIEFCKAGIGVYSSKDTFESLHIINHNTVVVKEKVLFTAGPYSIIPFGLVHDVTNFGYLISHKELGVCVFLTDTHYCPYKFNNLTNIIIEANYSKDLLNYNVENGNVHPIVKSRVQKSHMEITTTKEFLSENDLSKVNNIVLIHLSDNSSNERQFKEDIELLTGKTVHIAKKGMEIPFDKTPF